MIDEQIVRQDGPAVKRRIIPTRAFCALLNDCSPTTLWRLSRTDPAFPRSVAIGTGMRGFLEHEVDAYIELLIVRRDSGEVPAVEITGQRLTKMRQDRRVANGAPEGNRTLASDLGAAQAPKTKPGHCRDCGAPITRTGARGRPPSRCAACRGLTDPAS